MAQFYLNNDSSSRMLYVRLSWDRDNRAESTRHSLLTNIIQHLLSMLTCAAAESTVWFTLKGNSKLKVIKMLQFISFVKKCLIKHFCREKLER